MSAPLLTCCLLNSLSRVDPGLDKLPTAGLPRVRFSETGDIGLLLLGSLARLSQESEDISLAFIADKVVKKGEEKIQLWKKLVFKKYIGVYQY